LACLAGLPEAGMVCLTAVWLVVSGHLQDASRLYLHLVRPFFLRSGCSRQSSRRLRGPQHGRILELQLSVRKRGNRRLAVVVVVVAVGQREDGGSARKLSSAGECGSPSEECVVTARSSAPNYVISFVQRCQGLSFHSKLAPLSIIMRC
jgi:hypothetical protein